MKFKMLTAKQARKNANEKNKYSPIFRFIIKEIKMQSNKGFYLCSIFAGKQKLTEDELRYLKQAGFKVEYNDLALYYQIKW